MPPAMKPRILNDAERAMSRKTMCEWLGRRLPTQTGTAPDSLGSLNSVDSNISTTQITDSGLQETVAATGSQLWGANLAAASTLAPAGVWPYDRRPEYYDHLFEPVSSPMHEASNSQQFFCQWATEIENEY